MARSILQQTSTPTDELRDLLDACYNTAVNSHGASADVLIDLLYDLDRIEKLIPQLESLGADLRPERVKWQAVQGAVRRHSSDILSGLQARGGLKQLRRALPTPPNPQTQWWWFLDEERAAARRKRLAIATVLIVGVLALLAGGVVAFQKLFPVDSNMVAAYEHKLRAEDLLTHGKLEEAVAQLELARALTPDDPDILAQLAALYDLTQQPEKARKLIDQLSTRYPPSIAHANLGQAYLTAGVMDKALSMALQAISEDPTNPHGYLIAGMVYEAQGDPQRAMAMYRHAAETASAAEDHQTEAFAKVRLANLLQRLPVTPSP